MNRAREFRIHDRAQLQRVASLLAQMMVSEERPLAVSVAPYSAQRTNAQNRFLHSLLRDVSENVEVNGKRFSPQSWKEWFRQRYIGAEEIELPDGRRIERGISTTTLNVGQMAEAITQFESYLASEHGYMAEEV